MSRPPIPAALRNRLIRLLLSFAPVFCFCSALAQSSPEALRRFLFLQSSDPLSPPTEADQALEALEEEASGFCLVPQGTLPVGWLLASPTQTAAVIGRSFATYRADAQDEQCPPPPPCCAVGQGGGAEGNADGNNCSGNGSAENNCFCLVAPCHCPGGLPHCRISKPFMNVWLEDEP